MITKLCMHNLILIFLIDRIEQSQIANIRSVEPLDLAVSEAASISGYLKGMTP